MATQVSLNDGAVASAGALAIQTNGTTQAVSISTGQVATLAQNPILTSGTANGVAYLNGSKAVTSGSALVFDGTNLGVGISPTSDGAIHVHRSGASFPTIKITNGTTGSGNLDGFDLICGSGGEAYVYNREAQPLLFGTSNTERMRLDSSGNLGIGTTSPAAKFEVSTGAGTKMRLTSTADNNADIDFYTNSVYRGIIEFNSVGGLIYTIPSLPLTFGTGNQERARIDSSGNLLVGTTSPSGNGERINVTGTSTSFIGYFNNTSTGTRRGIISTYSGSSPPNDTGNEFIYCNDITAVRMTVRSNGGIGNYSANDVNLSDRREKTNFALAGDYLAKICAIPVQTFNYIDQSEDDPGLTLGVVAQDVQAVAPELVMESNWGTEEEPKMRLSIYQTDLQYALMKCIQEQQALITTLTARITALEGA